MIKIFTVDTIFTGMRIDRFIKKKINNIPQSLIEKSLRNGKIKLNNRKVKSSFRIKISDKIYCYGPFIKKNISKKKNTFQPNNEIIKSSEKLIIDENNDFIAVNKSAGIAVQGGTKSRKNLIDIFSKSKIFNDDKPYTVHRLDKDTSGVFILAKNRKSAQLLTSLFRLRKVHKTYMAICEGEIINNQGILTDNLIRYDNNKKIVEKAETYYKVLDKNSNCSLVEMRPVTGRKHQLRKQFLLLGHPIVGDKKYNTKISKKEKSSKNLMLHSYKITKFYNITFPYTQ